MIIFSTTIRVDGELPVDPQKDDLAIYVEGPDKSIRLNVMGGPKSVYHIGFTPKDPGQYWVDFVFRGIWAEKPHQLDISDTFQKVPPFPYQGIYRSQAKSGTVLASQSVEGLSEDKMQEEELAKQQKIDEDKANVEEEQKRKRLKNEKKRSD